MGCAAYPVLLALALVLIGCSHNKAKVARVQGAQSERVKELVAVAKIANARIAPRTPAAALSGQALDRVQSLVGFSLQPMDHTVDDLLSSNEVLQAKARLLWDKAVAQETEWRTKEAQYQAALVEMGGKYEAEKNKSIVKRVWHWAIGTFGIAGLIALCIFCPAAIPLIVRLFGMLVSKVPALASWVGVVSVKAYDSIIHGVQNAKEKLKVAPGGENATEILHAELDKSQDANHKRLVAQRKAVAV